MKVSSAVDPQLKRCSVGLVGYIIPMLVRGAAAGPPILCFDSDDLEGYSTHVSSPRFATLLASLLL